MNRRCGDCQLCCKLLPVKEFGKRGNTRCQYQRTGKGCTIYDRRPLSCHVWSCRWLTNDGTEHLSRPDRSGYVIDMMPDIVKVRDDKTGDITPLAVLQIWIDPARPDAWRDDNALFSYVKLMGETHQMAALMRFGSRVATCVMPPSLTVDGEWYMIASGVVGDPHTAADMLAAGFDMKMVLEG